ncbi:hypothetical protein [Nocardioides sp. InS609-2]|uniref:Rv1678 family membrane protein n=1 Tax=Nocardioides sp. InS609-2 TaxID=2760705 RepID=UPI0020C08FE7|nr:hypothetical protein [Nocardioides sp. InS609-2]
MPETTTTRPGMMSAVGWLLAPAADEAPRAHAVGATALRILLGLMWLYNVSWKRAPDFGKSADNGLYHFTAYAVSHPVFPPYSWVVEHLVLPNFTPFGWLVLVLETALAVLLLTGSWVRLAAALGIVQSVAIGLSVAYAPNEWPWSYWLMIGAHLILLVSAGGRILATDAVRAGRTTGRVLGQVWGGLTMLVGLSSAVRSFGDPLATRGPDLGSSDLSVSLGAYNMVGGLVLVVAGALLVLAARSGVRRLAVAAAVLSALAGLSLHAQLGFSDPFLGGTPTSAAYLFCLAVVGAWLGRSRAHAGVAPPDHVDSAST